MPAHRLYASTLQYVLVQAYNTGKIKKEDLPKTYEDLLAPKWKGKLGIEAGADDVQEDGENIEITAPVDAFKTLSDALRNAKVSPDDSGLRLIAKQDLELDVGDEGDVVRAQRVKNHRLIYPVQKFWPEVFFQLLKYRLFNFRLLLIYH